MASSTLSPPLARRGARRWPLLLLALAGAAGPNGAAAQTSTPQETYDAQIAACNDADLPRPQRNACVRAAGQALDQSQGGAPAPDTQTSADGRAVVITPPDGPPPAGDGQAVPTPDGRALVVPADDGGAAR